MTSRAASDMRMPPLRARRLTAGEHHLCAQVFGEGLEPSEEGLVESQPILGSMK